MNAKRFTTSFLVRSNTIFFNLHRRNYSTIFSCNFHNNNRIFNKNKNSDKILVKNQSSPGNKSYTSALGALTKDQVISIWV